MVGVRKIILFYYSFKKLYYFLKHLLKDYLYVQDWNLARLKLKKKTTITYRNLKVFNI